MLKQFNSQAVAREVVTEFEKSLKEMREQFIFRYDENSIREELEYIIDEYSYETSYIDDLVYEEAEDCRLDIFEFYALKSLRNSFREVLYCVMSDYINSSYDEFLSEQCRKTKECR